MSAQDRRDLSGLREFYPRHLVEHVLPFYTRHALDREHGGYTTCLDNRGQVLATDKYIWSQGRGLWTFAAAYNRMGRDGAYLDAGRLGAEFLKRYGRDEQGRWCYRVSREGQNLEGPTSVYADMFVVYGLTEYYRASGDLEALRLAYRSCAGAWRRARDPAFDAVAPYRIQKGWRTHGVAMIFLEAAGELARSVDDPQLEEWMRWCVDAILNDHCRKEYGLLIENITQDGKLIDAPEGRIVNPGHTIESMWFLLHYAQRRGRADLIEPACQMIRAALEFGWDEQYGGLFHALDVQTRQPTDAYPFGEYKLWWPHTEALYALLLVDELRGHEWARQWYWKVHEWSLAHLVCPHGDWYQRLDRQARPVETVVALPVKDPYHLPRVLILGYQSLCRRQGIKTVHDPFERFEQVPAGKLG